MTADSKALLQPRKKANALLLDNDAASHQRGSVVQEIHGDISALMSFNVFQQPFKHEEMKKASFCIMS